MIRGTATVARRDAEVAARLRLTVGRLMRVVRQNSEGGLTPSQVSALATLEELGTIRLTDFAARENVGAPVASRVVDGLERLGLVQRVTHATDRRCCLVELTPAGEQRIDALSHESTATLTERIRRLSAGELAVLNAALPVLDALVRDDVS